MLKFKATNTQVLQMAANAANASLPMGMGFIHFKADSVFKLTDFRFSHRGSADTPVVHVDYHEGRMVKLLVEGKGDGVWLTHGGDADPEYQSWSGTYPSFQSLVESVGAEILSEDA